MKSLLALPALCLAAAAAAQSPLVVAPVAGVPGQVLTTSAPGVNYYDLTVNTAITLQALEIATFDQAGIEGSINFYMTDGQTAATQTHIGNEQIPGNWTLMASGPYVSPGLTAFAQTCLTPGVVIQPGTYGIAIEYVDLLIELVGVTNFQTFSNAELTVENGTFQADLFVSAPQGPFVFGNPPLNYVGMQSRVNFIYSNGSVPHACSNAQIYGEGCYKRSASPYQLWDDTADADAALTGTSMTYIMNVGGDGYTLVSPGIATYLDPNTSGLVTNTLAAGDDLETMITTAVPITYPSEAGFQNTNTLYIHANGYISAVGSNDQLSGANFIPTPNSFLDAPETAWWSWHDFNNEEAGSGDIVWQEDPITGTLFVTWDDVESSPIGTVNRSTVQFQFDVAGNVSIIWELVDPIGGNTQFGGDSTLIGFSPGGPSPDAGEFDLTQISGVIVEFPETAPLSLQSSATPLIGTNIELETFNAPGTSLGVLFFGLTQVNPGADLAIIGMGGCNAYIDPNAAVGNLISNIAPNSLNVPLPIPNDPTLAAAQFTAQSIWLQPGVNAFGAIVSNGVLLTLGSF